MFTAREFTLQKYMKFNPYRDGMLRESREKFENPKKFYKYMLDECESHCFHHHALTPPPALPSDPIHEKNKVAKLNLTWCISSNFDFCSSCLPWMFVNLSSRQLSNGRPRATSFDNTSSLFKFTFLFHCFPSLSTRCSKAFPSPTTSYKSEIAYKLGVTDDQVDQA